MDWSLPFAHKVAKKAIQDRLISRHGDHLKLSGFGRETAKDVMTFV